jgi:endonuclease YncB( thermonuclease family)
MKRTVLLTVLSLAVLAIGTLLAQQLGVFEPPVIYGRVVSVVDGDNIQVLTPDYRNIRVRLAFIDAPEKGQPYGYAAKQAMSQLVFGKNVTLLPHATDRYGRTVARVMVEGTDADLELLKQGRAAYGSNAS